MSVKLEEIGKDIPRHLNCLSNENKATRRRSIEALRKETVQRQPRLNPAVLNGAFHELCRPLLSLFSDPVASCRELAISVVGEFIEEVSEPHDFLQVVVPVLVQRLGQQNVVEPMEEARHQLVQLLHRMVQLTGKRVAPYLDDLIKILQRTIVDSFAEVKKESCGCASSVARSIPEHFHMQSESLIAPLIQKDTIGHQHSKVRVAVVKAIGDVIRYGNGKSVDDVVSHLAQLMFDATPAVRQAVTHVIGNWLLDLPDRYSFHHKLIPLLLTSLTDEYPTIQSEAEAFWQDVGEKYASENDKDLKDKMDFEKPNLENYPKGFERPSLGCRTLVYHNFSKILSGITGDLMHSSLVPATRVKSAQLLYTLLINEEGNVTQHLEKVLTTLKASCNDEEKLVQEYIFKSAKLLGYFVSPEIWCRMLLQNIRLAQADGPSDTFPNLLCLLAAFIQGSDKESIQPHVADIVDVIGTSSVCRFPATKLQLGLLLVVSSLIDISGDDCQSVSFTLFNVLVSVIALHRQEVVRHQAEELLLKLAEVQAINRAQLFQNHLEPMLGLMEESSKSWTQHSEERFVFDTLLIEAGEAAVTVLDKVMKILRVNLDPSKDADVRSKFFSLLSHLVTSSTARDKGSANGYEEYAITIIRDMILPNCVWRAGRTAEVIRKMAVLTLRILLTEDGFVTPEQLLSVVDELLTQMRSTLDDDGRETRLVSCQVLSRIFDLVGDRLHEDHRLYNLYPDLLKRLDDSSDDVRIEATKTFASYFRCLCKKFEVATYGGHLEAIFKGLLLHLDDTQEDVQGAVLETLKAGSHVHPDMLLKEIDSSRHKLRCTSSCDILVEFINSLPKPE